MALASLTDRMARVKRGQARALAGECGPAPIEAANDPQAPATRSVEQERAGLMREFESLLPTITAFYGFEQADVSCLRGFVSAVTPAAHRELALCVRQWRLDAVVYDLREQLPEDVALRAWIQFRLSVMGESVDEMGVPYPEDALRCPAPEDDFAGEAPF